MEGQSNIIEFIDENNNIICFEYIMGLEYNEQQYLLLKPVDGPNGSTEEEEVVILKVKRDKNGEDVYVTIDDENELEEVFDIFNQILEQDAKNGIH